MYCNKCGKYIEYDAPICRECEANEAAQAPKKDYYIDENINAYDGEVEIEPADAHNRMYGFGPALTSTILSFVGFIFSYISLFGFVFEEMAVSLVLILFGIGFSIPSIILGIKSIVTFVRRKREGAAKPIPALVLGINGAIFAGTSFFILGIAAIIATAFASVY